MTVEVKADQVFLCFHESSGSDIVRWIRLLRMAYCIVHRWMDGWTSVKEVKEAPCSVLSEFQISLFLCLFFVTKSAYKHFGKLGHVTHGPPAAC